MCFGIPDGRMDWQTDGELFLHSFALGDFWSAIANARLNTPAYWNGISWIFEGINPAVTIIVRAAEAN